jgi:SAM-dependent methyltransferase
MANPDPRNVYDDEARASAYAELRFPGTYYLAFRDLPSLFARYIVGRRALDFGCGTGRSTRYLRDLGFEAVGVDISRPMLEKARELDPDGDYRQVGVGDLGPLGDAAFDLVLSAFTFDNMATLKARESALLALTRLLAPGGRIVNVVSSPDIYVNEWASFSTREYPQNARARSGDEVLIVMLDVADRRPVVDFVCSDEDYRALYGGTGLSVMETLRPLATGEEPIEWVSETKIAPWVIYVLGAAG